MEDDGKPGVRACPPPSFSEREERIPRESRAPHRGRHYSLLRHAVYSHHHPPCARFSRASTRHLLLGAIGSCKRPARRLIMPSAGRATTHPPTPRAVHEASSRPHLGYTELQGRRTMAPWTEKAPQNRAGGPSQPPVLAALRPVLWPAGCRQGWQAAGALARLGRLLVAREPRHQREGGTGHGVAMLSSDAVGGHTAPTALAAPRTHADAPLERPAARCSATLAGAGQASQDGVE